MAPPRQIRRGDGYITERRARDGTVRFQARWHDGARWRAKTFPDLDAAEDHLRDVGRRRRRGLDVAVSDLTVDELVADYLARGQHRWAANTLATYRLLARRQIGPGLGRVRVAELTAVRVQRWLDRLTGQVSASVVQSARTILSGACRDAVRLGIIPANPVTGARTPARPRAERQTWTAVQVQAALAAVAGDVLLHALYLVALTTGVRPGELRALMWRDLDLERGVLTVRRTMTRDADFRHRVGTTTKTRRVRAVALPEVTVEALRVHRADQLRRRLAAAAWHDGEVVFDRGDGAPLAQQTLANRHRAVCERAGVPRIRMHDLRHTFATIALEQGTHPKIVSEILGHASITTTLDIYSHVDVDLQRAAITAVTGAMTERRRAGSS